MFPLPVEGAETKVLADDQEVANYMIDLGDLLETVSGWVWWEILSHEESI